MKKRIWKYQLKVQAGEQVIQMPSGAEILHIESQRKDYITKRPALWALVDFERHLVDRTLFCVGTGKNFDEYTNSMVYLGTYQIDDDFEVIHVFEKI